MFSPLNFFGKEATLVVDRVRVCSPSSIMFHFWCRVSHCSWFKKWCSAPGRSRGHSHFYHFESAHQLAVTPYVYDPTYVYIYICVCVCTIFSYGQLSYPIYLFIYFICIHAHICIHNICTSILSLPFRTTFIIVWGWQRLRNRKQKSKAMESFWTPLAVAEDDLTFLGAAGGKCSDEGWLMRVYLI